MVCVLGLMGDTFVYSFVLLFCNFFFWCQNIEIMCRRLIHNHSQQHQPLLHFHDFVFRAFLCKVADGWGSFCYSWSVV